MIFVAEVGEVHCVPRLAALMIVALTGRSNKFNPHPSCVHENEAYLLCHCGCRGGGDDGRKERGRAVQRFPRSKNKKGVLNLNLLHVVTRLQ